MRGFGLLFALCAFLAAMGDAGSAGRYDGWSGNDCVSMGKSCIANCDKYGVPETKAACMLNCSSTAMQCMDTVKGGAAEMSPGVTEGQDARGSTRVRPSISKGRATQ